MFAANLLKKAVPTLSLQNMNHTIKRHSFNFSLFISLAKTSLADFFAQSIVERKAWGEIDWRRNAAFSLFGLGYLGGFQYFLYNKLFPRVFRPWMNSRAKVDRVRSTIGQLVIDEFFFVPTLYFPVFYLVKDAVNGIYDPRATFDRYRQDALQLWIMCWAVWFPAHTLTFSKIPSHLRIPWTAAVSFAWTVVWSLSMGRMDKSRELESAKASVTLLEDYPPPALLAEQSAAAALQQQVSFDFASPLLTQTLHQDAFTLASSSLVAGYEEESAL